MQRAQWGVSIVVAAGILAAAAPRAGAQGTNFDPNATATDSLMLAPSTYRFTPLFVNNITGDVSSVYMLNQFSTGLATPFGPSFDLNLMKSEKHYRLNANRDETRKLLFSGFHPLRFGLTTSIGYTNSRVSNLSSVSGGSSQVYTFNDNGFTVGASYKRTHAGMRVDAAANASALNGERTFKTDETVGGGIGGGVAANVLGDRVVVQARGAYRESSETSRTTSSVFDGLGASEDSISGVVRVSLADSITVRVSHAAFNGLREYADQAQGSLGGQIPGEENVIPETEDRYTRATLVSMSSQLWTGFVITLDASHEDQQSSYLVQTTRFSRNVIDLVKGTVSYLMPWKTTASVNFDNTETLRDLGPQSVSSFTEKRKRASLALSHPLTKTWTVRLSGSSTLSQTFYLDTEANPRDRDQVDNLINLSMSSVPYTNVTANIGLAYVSNQFINIDESQSRNNRHKEQFDLRPSYSWTVWPWLTISQTYGVVIEHTEYDYVPEDNFLDRNLFLWNTFAFKPAERVSFRFDYRLNVHDKGSYLPSEETGDEVLTVESEDRRNQLNLSLDYQITDKLAFFTDYRYNQFVDRVVSSDVETSSTDGLISVGTSGNYTWSNNRRLTFMLARVKRFSPSDSDREKDYWDMRSELNFPL